MAPAHYSYVHRDRCVPYPNYEEDEMRLYGSQASTSRSARRYAMANRPGGGLDPVIGPVRPTRPSTFVSMIAWSGERIRRMCLAIAQVFRERVPVEIPESVLDALHPVVKPTNAVVELGDGG